MDRNDWLAERLEAQRTRMHALAYRMLASLSAADGAVQEAALQISWSEMSGVANLGFNPARPARLAGRGQYHDGADLPRCGQGREDGTARTTRPGQCCADHQARGRAGGYLMLTISPATAYAVAWRPRPRDQEQLITQLWISVIHHVLPHRGGQHQNVLLRSAIAFVSAARSTPRRAA
jgi:hypothetical protein